MIKTLFSNFLTRSGEISYTKRHLRHSAAKSFNFVKFDLLCFMDHEFVENNIKQKHPTIPNPNLGNISICGLNCVSQFKEYPGSSFCPGATLPSSASFVTRAQIPSRLPYPPSCALPLAQNSHSPLNRVRFSYCQGLQIRAHTFI